MKLLINIIVLLPILAISQRDIKFGNIPLMAASYNTYTAKDGQIISFKDSITIGIPSGADGFRFITRDWVGANNIIAGRKLPIKRIRSFQRRLLRNKIFLEIRPYGISPIFVDYEMAFESGEIIADPKEIN
jgi:hypothetical protein